MGCWTPELHHYRKKSYSCILLIISDHLSVTMKQVSSIIRVLAVLTVLNIIIAANKDNVAEAIFFLDLLCASRIDALEKQVSQLVALSRTNNPANQASTPNLLDLNG